MEKKPIIGRMVIVHPDLTTDPIQMQGKAGKVIAFEADTLEVEFSDTQWGKYVDDGLLTTLPKQIILSVMVATRSLLNRDNTNSVQAVEVKNAASYA